jgi:hypothetical protein
MYHPQHIGINQVGNNNCRLCNQGRLSNNLLKTIGKPAGYALVISWDFLEK